MFLQLFSQASVVARGIGRLLSKGKMFFPSLGLEKQISILKPGVITSVRSTNSPNLVHIGCEMAPPWW